MRQSRIISSKLQNTHDSSWSRLRSLVEKARRGYHYFFHCYYLLKEVTQNEIHCVIAHITRNRERDLKRLKSRTLKRSNLAAASNKTKENRQHVIVVCAQWNLDQRWRWYVVPHNFVKKLYITLVATYSWLGIRARLGIRAQLWRV